MTTPAKEWSPLHWTKPLSENFPTRGDDVIAVAETFFSTTRGMTGAGTRFRLTDWQKWLLRAIYEERPDGRLRYRTVVVGLPRKNGKTQVIAAPAILEQLIFGGVEAEIASIGAVLRNAEDVYEFVEAQVAASPFLRRHIKVTQKGMRARTGAKYEIFAADKSSRLQGQSKSLITIDEFHEFLTPKQVGAYLTARSGQGDRAESLTIITTTAGENIESKMGNLYKSGIKVANGDFEDDSLGFFWWGADPEDDITDPATWRKANPNLALGLMAEDFIPSQLAAAEAEGKLNEFLRYHLNIWTRTEQEGYITHHHWEQAKRKGAVIEKGDRIAVGFDGSLNNDSTAFVGISLETGVIEVLAEWHKDPTDPNWIVPRDEVLEAKDRIFHEYDVATLYADTQYWKTEIQQWSAEHYPKVVDLKQSAGRVAEVYADFKKEIIGGVIVHPGHAKLTEHAMNAVIKPNGVIAKEKGQNAKKIDLVVASAFAAEGRRIAIERDKATESAYFGF